MDEYLAMKKDCCADQQNEWNKMIEDAKKNNLSDDLWETKLLDQKAEMFEYYVDLRASLLKVPNKEYVRTEMSLLFEKMVELAEFNDGTDLGRHNFKVSRFGAIEGPTTYMVAVMGPDDVDIGRGSILAFDAPKSSLGKVKVVYIGRDVQGISDYAFELMINLTHVHFHPDSSCLTIGVCAFYECQSLIEISIPDEVRIIEKQAFLDCQSLREVTIGSNVNSIADEVFRNCMELKSIYIPPSVQSIGESCFSMFTEGGVEGGLQEITGMEGVETIGANAFSGCDLKRFSGGPNLKNIGTTCFYGTQIEEMTLVFNPELTIEDGAFDYLGYLSIVNLIGGKEDQWIEKLKGQFEVCDELDDKANSWASQINRKRVAKGYDETVSDVVIYVVYAREFEGAIAQTWKLPGDLAEYEISSFSPRL